MEPITRIEHYLASIVDGASNTLTPITRIEKYLDAILNGTTDVPTPITRIEFYLAAIAGVGSSFPVPITRVEFYLAAIAGADVEPPVPIIREEMWLYEWWESGSVEGVSMRGGVLEIDPNADNVQVTMADDTVNIDNGTPGNSLAFNDGEVVVT